LRRAQLRLLRGPTDMPPADDAPFLERLRRAVRGPRRVDARHPYYWAPFQVIGGPEIS